MKINSKTEALWASAEHWLDNYNLAVKEDVSSIRIYGEDCPCCQFTEDRCGMCPIMETTTLPGCEGTPWVSVNKNVRDWKKKVYHSKAEHMRLVRCVEDEYRCLVDIALNYEE